MTANEAPNKIYLYSSDRAGEEYEAEWADKPWGEDCVEYTRTDAFIEKAKKYLEEHFINEVSVIAGGYVNIRFNQAFENFIKYMKGE